MGYCLQFDSSLQTYLMVDACIKFKQDEDLQDVYDMSLAVVAAVAAWLLPTQQQLQVQWQLSQNTRAGASMVDLMVMMIYKIKFLIALFQCAM